MKIIRRCHRLRRAIYALLLGAPISQSRIRPSNAEQVLHMHRVLDCGAIVITADTRLMHPDDDFDPRGLAQTIRLQDVPTGHSVILPLFQHWSKNNKLHRSKALDGLVWAFESLTSKTGEVYVKLLWDCANPNATTCESAMDKRDEWIAAYDRFGHSIPVDPHAMRPSDQRHLESLGLWPAFIQGDLDKNGGYTYFFKQVDPKGHIR